MLTYLYCYLSTFFQDEEGQGMAEYGLILALVAVAAVVALGVLSGGVNGILNNVGGELTGAIPSS